MGCVTSARALLRWPVLVAVFLANALPEFLWSNFPPIMTDVASRFGVGELGASLPVISFSVGTVVASGIAGRVVDSFGYTVGFRLGLALVAGFALTRAVDGPLWLLVLAQGGIGAAFAFIVASNSSYVIDWFDARHESLVTGVCVIGLYSGLGSSMIVTPLLVEHLGFMGTMRITAAASMLLLLICAPLIVRRCRRAVPAPDRAKGAVTVLLRIPRLVLQFVISFLQQGVFSAVAAALEVVWHARGFSAAQAGLANGLFICGGMLGSFVLPAMQLAFGCKRLLIVCYLAALLLTWPLFVAPTPTAGNAIAFVIGAFWLGSVPVALTFMERTAGSLHTGTASSLYWAFGSAGSVALVWMFGAIADSASWQSAAIAMLVLLAANQIATFLLPNIERCELQTVPGALEVPADLAGAPPGALGDSATKECASRS